MNQVKVNVIRRKGQSALVQFVDDDGLQRIELPSSSVGEDGLVDELELGMGMPYGLRWEEIVQFSVTPEMLADELRRRGIWTLDNLMVNMQGAVGAFQAIYGVDASRLLKRARQYQKNRGGTHDGD